MNLPQLPSFDEAIIWIAGLLGLSPFILALLGLAFRVQSWYQGLRDLASGVRTAHSVLGRAGAALARMRPVQIAATAFVTVAVPLAQALTLGMCFLGGNYLSMFVHTQRWQTAAAVVEADPAHLLDPDRLSQFLALDWICAAYLIVAIGAIIKSYQKARGHESLTGTGAVLALPASALLFLGAILVPLTLALVVLAWLLALMAGDGQESFRRGLTIMLPQAVGMSIVGIYYGVCQAAVHGSRLVIRAWNIGTPAGRR